MDVWLDGFVAAWRQHAQAGGPAGEEAAGRILELFDVDGVWEDVDEPGRSFEFGHRPCHPRGV
jgi:hypothetical protein